MEAALSPICRSKHCVQVLRAPRRAPVWSTVFPARKENSGAAELVDLHRKVRGPGGPSSRHFHRVPHGPGLGTLQQPCAGCAWRGPRGPHSPDSTAGPSPRASTTFAESFPGSPGAEDMGFPQANTTPKHRRNGRCCPDPARAFQET